MRNRILLLTLVFIVGSSQSRFLNAQETNNQHAGVVLRVSKSLIDELTDEVIEADIPFSSTILRGHVKGTATGRAKLHIDLKTDNHRATFLIIARGQAKAKIIGTRGNYRVDGSVVVPFVVHKTVIFDGLRYHSAGTSSRVCIKSTVHSVSSRRGKLLAAIGRPLAKQTVLLLKDKAERQANPEAVAQLEKFVNTEADEVIAELNQITQLEKSIQKLYPETKNWTYRLSTHPEYLQAYYGPKEAAVPTLPNVKDLPQDAGMELWVQVQPEEARFLKLLAEWNQTHDLLGKLIPDSDPEIKALVKDAKVTVAEPWVIISIAQPAKAANAATNGSR